MGCIKPPLAVSQPTQRTAGRLAFRGPAGPSAQAVRAPATLEEGLIDVSAAADIAAAKQAGNRALREIRRATSTKDIDRVMVGAKAELEAAIAKTKIAAEQQSLRDRARNLEKAASEQRVHLQVEECLAAGFPRNVITASSHSTPHELAAGYAIVGRKPRSSEHAGTRYQFEPDQAIAEKYPNSVEFSPEGFPDFSPYEIARVELAELTGNRAKDFALAYQAAGIPKQPGFTWHHVEDGQTLVLVPSDLHHAVPHTGGVARDKNMRGLQSTLTIGLLGSIVNDHAND